MVEVFEDVEKHVLHLSFEFQHLQALGIDVERASEYAELVLGLFPFEIEFVDVVPLVVSQFLSFDVVVDAEVMDRRQFGNRGAQCAPEPTVGNLGTKLQRVVEIHVGDGGLGEAFRCEFPVPSLEESDVSQVSRRLGTDECLGHILASVGSGKSVEVIAVLPAVLTVVLVDFVSRFHEDCLPWDDLHLAECSRHGFELYPAGHFAGFNLGRLISHETESQRCVGVNFQCEIALGVGDGTNALCGVNIDVG